MALQRLLSHLINEGCFPPGNTDKSVQQAKKKVSEVTLSRAEQNLKLLFHGEIQLFQRLVFIPNWVEKLELVKEQNTVKAALVVRWWHFILSSYSIKLQFSVVLYCYIHTSHFICSFMFLKMCHTLLSSVRLQWIIHLRGCLTSRQIPEFLC